MAISRVIEVSFGRSSVALVRVNTAYFYNSGIIFKPTDIELPTSYQVHWADSPDKATTLETIGTAEGAPIPDDLWNRSRVIYGWIYLHPTEDSGITAYEVRIYKNVRAGLPDGTEPTPAEQSTIDQLIGALNSAVEQTGEDVESAEQAKDDAESARNNAQNYANNAQSSAQASASSAESASQSAQTASASATASAQSASASAQIKADVEDLVDDAQSYAESALIASQASVTARDTAQGYAQSASASAQSASTSASAAQTYANTASAKASEASASASTASTKATEASQSAENASQSAQTAESAKTASQTAQGLAESARDTAVSAKTDAESAKADAESARDAVQSSAAQITTNAKDITQLKEELTRFETIIPILAGRGKTWAEIKQNVKMGYGEILYPVGTEFEVECPSGAPYNSIIFVVVDHRVENSEHIMTMLMKHVIYSTEFDAIQAIICPEETMPAGTYHFALLSGYDTAYDGGKNVQFTLAHDLEAGGQIVMNWPYNQTWIGKNLTVYHAFGTSAIETCVMSEGTGGTDLGVADGTVSILNHTQRARYGSNNYKESAIREWLDSDDAANAWQTQQTRFQRPCSYRNRAGFVTYLDPEFVAVIREGTHPNRTNEVFDLNGKKQAYSTTDKFYLVSQEEIGFSSESGIVCGSVFDYYNGASQADKIKYGINSQAAARYWWLRTPYPSYAGNERNVNSSGALNVSNASNGLGAVAACEI